MKIRQVIGHLRLANPDYRHPFLHERPVKRVGMIIISSDRGLCGGLNINLFRAALAEIAKAEGKSVDGLEKALATEMKKKLDAAVKAGKLTQSEAARGSSSGATVCAKRGTVGTCASSPVGDIVMRGSSLACNVGSASPVKGGGGTSVRVLSTST